MPASTLHPSDPPSDKAPLDHPEEVTIHERPQRPMWFWILVLLLLVLLSEEVAYAFNLVTPALPHMAEAFKTDQLAWVSTAFSLSGAISAPIFGKLADKYGKKKWLLVSAALMACGSLIVWLAPSFSWVIAGRVVEGFGLGIVPITYSLMRDIFPPKMIALAVSISTAGIGVTTIVGPYLAGFLIDRYGYKGVFGFLFILPVIIGILILLVVPESPVRVHANIDWLGAALLGGGLAGMLFAIGEGTAWGWLSAKTIGVFGVGVLLLIAWWIRARSTKESLIDTSLVSSRPVALTMIANFMAQGVITIQFVALSFIAQVPREVGVDYGLGQTASEMAWITSPAGVMSVLMGFTVGWLAERRGARLPGWVGFAFMAVGSTALLMWHDTMTQVVVGYLVYAIGGGMVSAAIPNLVIAAVPVEQQAVSASTVGVVGTLGSTIAVQAAFAILAVNVLQVLEGTPIYSEGGFMAVYGVAVGMAVVGLLATVLMRHGLRPQSAEALEQ